MDYRSKNDIKKEKELLCILRNSKTLYLLANKILFRYIKIAKKYNIDNESIISKLKSKFFNDIPDKKYSRVKSPDFKLNNDIITKNGYECTKLINCNQILNFENYKQLYDFNKENNISLLKITSAFYMFQMDNILFTNIIKKSQKLQKKITKTFNLYFNTNYDFKKINRIVEKSEGNWFYTWLLVFLESHVENLMHRNLNEDKDYIRKWIFEIKTPQDISIIKQKDITCIKNTYDTKDNIMRGNTYMKPIINGIWWNTMKKNKKEIIAGPSSSAVLLYNSIFNITKILSNTIENKILLLCLILADYSEIHHSMSEILQLYTKDANLIEYKLENNDVNYILTLINKYNIEL